MVVLYCPTERVNTEPIQLFVELADMDPVEDVTSLRQQYGIEDLCTEVPRTFVDMKLSMRCFDIDLNIGCADQYDGSNNNGHSDHKCEDFSDPGIDEISDDIDNGGAYDKNDYTLSLRNPSHGIVIRNDRGAHISIIDPDTAYAYEFPEYPNIIPTHLMLADPESEEFFDHCKLDLKTMCNCVLPMVKDMPTILVSMLIFEMKEQFQYRVSYRKAWLDKQMTMDQVYRDWDVS
ncbi:hypothetical protein GOBAR_AA16468 [Gossypium barbadense]|uniref:Uncharacterized protein n=1 Tax=Gossypium barbadense TaxID=3634 RepID=A0A2P5XLK8_GOSBA|nr:hypothetical protein GOBAR_AA16468 [Gossypium barbadense]